MKTIDINWLRKILTTIEKLQRTTNSKSKDCRCEKEIFICRYFKFLENKYFKIKIKNRVYFAVFPKSTTTVSSCLKDDYKYNSYGIKFHLGYTDFEYQVSFRDEQLNVIQLILHWNDIIEIKYKEITAEEYFNVVKMFLFEEKLELI